MKTAFLFSGQGSQYVGMLNDIYQKFPLAKEMVDKANSILGYPLSDIMFNGPLEQLKETRYTQPALLLHSSVVYNLIKDKTDFKAVAGHSVGEYAALYSAGVLSFEDTLNLVSLRGKLMFESGKKEPGTMFAIINLEDDKVNEVCEKLTNKNERKYIVAANFNSPGQVVVSGTADYLRENVDEFKKAGARLVKELVVSGAFHSPLMESSKQELAEAIDAIDFHNTEKSVYVNITGKPLMQSNDIKKALIEQLTSPVLWTQTLKNMKSDGVTKFVEVGPGSVLQGLVKRTLKDVDFYGFDKYEDIVNNI